MQSLKVQDLTLQLPDGTLLCESLSFEIAPGAVLALMGPSGSGKSSILSWITGTLDSRIQAKGDVWLGDVNVGVLPVERRGLGLMLQQDYLFPHMTVSQNLKFGLRGGSRAERNQKVKDSLNSAGLSGMEDRHPTTLSGGQRARVSLLRTLLSNPHALLLDEPFSRLDVALRSTIREFAWESASQLPTLLVTHDIDDVPAHADKLSLATAQADQTNNLSSIPGYAR